MLDVPAARALLRQTRPRRHADGYPSDVRACVVVLVRARLANGLSLNAVARELGVSRTTLRQWLDRSPQVPPAFVPVLVQQPPESAGPPAPASRPTPRAASSSPLALVSPSGFRLDGLTLDDAIVALRLLS